LRIALARDAGLARRVPGKALAAVTMPAVSRGAWPLVRFRRPVRVTAGRFYYVVFTNLDPTPSATTSRSTRSRPTRAVARRRRCPTAWPSCSAGRRTGRHPTQWVSAVSAGATATRRSSRWRGGGPGSTRARLHGGLGQQPKPIGGGASVRQLLGTRPASRITGAWVRLRRRGGDAAPADAADRAHRGACSPRGRCRRARSAPIPQWLHVRFSKPVTVRGRAASPSSSRPPDGRPTRRSPSARALSMASTRTPSSGRLRAVRRWQHVAGWDQWGGHDLHTGDLQFRFSIPADN
jgi:hypothetical protein